MTTNIYDKVTAVIVEQLEKGIIPWQKPWDFSFAGNGAFSYATGKPYSLLNQWLLGLRKGAWLTFNQIQEAGGKIKAGEKASFVVFWKLMDKTIINEEGEEEVVGTIPLLRSYNVWHIDQCSGIEAKKFEEPHNDVSSVEKAEKIISEYFEAEGAPTLFIEPSNEAYYAPIRDEIHVPLREQYKDTNAFYSTLFHEMTHSTGHKKRLNRGSIGDEETRNLDSYSKEELVAEIGAAYLCNVSGIDSTNILNNSVAYIQSWSRRLKEDNRLIVSAAGKAEAAVKFILGEM